MGLSQFAFEDVELLLREPVRAGADFERETKAAALRDFSAKLRRLRSSGG